MSLDEMDPGTGELFPRPEVSTSERAFELQRAIRHDNAVRAQAKAIGGPNLNAKIVKALGDWAVLKKNVPKADGRVGSYTSFDRVMSMLVPRLRAEGIVIRHSTGRLFIIEKTFWLPVICHLIDKDTGESIECEMPIPIVRPDPHAMGSAFTYGKRYTLLGALGLATGDDGEDDDGYEAMPNELPNSTAADVLIAACEKTTTVADYDTWRNMGLTIKAISQLPKDEYRRLAMRAKTHLENLRADEAPAERPASFIESNPLPQKGASFAEVTGVGRGAECKHCGGSKETRNPTGKCDHLRWPENLTDEAKRANGLMTSDGPITKKRGPKNRIEATNEGGTA